MIMIMCAAVIGSVWICIREMKQMYYNPIPKFTDREKNENDIQFCKTRDIVFYGKQR